MRIGLMLLIPFCLSAATTVEIQEVKVKPDPLLVGEEATVECRLTGAEERASVRLVILERIEIPLQPRGKGIYQLTTTIPPESPTGTFPAAIVAKLPDGTEIRRALEITITEKPEERFASLPPTFQLEDHDGVLIPLQGGIIYPSLERQSTRPTLELAGHWYARRVPDADHELSLTKRTPEVIERLEDEVPELFADGVPQLNNDPNWTLLRVPAPVNPPPDRYQGCVWYVTSFHLPPDWRGGRTRLVFLAANYVADVWLNREWLGYHEGGYTPFVFDVSDHLRQGENLLYVRVDNIPWRPKRGEPTPKWLNHKDIVPYVCADWWNYGGILRDVYLEGLPATHVVRLDAHGGFEGEIPKLEGRVLVQGPVLPERVQLRLTPFRRDRSLEFRLDLCAGDEILLETEIPLVRIAPDLAYGRFALPVPDAKPWTPETPHLYLLQARLPSGDQFTTQIGFRDVRTEGARLLWNGEPIFLNGVSRHEDYPLTGRALSYADMWKVYRDLELIKEMGANFLRFSHYPNHPMTGLLTDRIGLIGWEEIPVYWFSDEGFRIQSLRGIARQMWLEMIYTDYNRPSIAFWSTCNECGGLQRRQEYIRVLHELADRVDGSRLVVQSAAGAFFDPTHKETDLIGMTLYFGVFYGKDPYEDTARLLDEVHARMPDKPILCTEFGYWAGNDWGSAEKQVRIAEETYRALRERDFVCGATWWIGFDYFTFHTGINTMGAITSDRHAPRPVYYRLRELWSSQPSGR